MTTNIYGTPWSRAGCFDEFYELLFTGRAHTQEKTLPNSKSKPNSLTGIKGMGPCVPTWGYFLLLVFPGMARSQICPEKTV